MSGIVVERLSEDGMSRKAWTFNSFEGHTGPGLVLIRYSEDTRASKRHKWNGDYWESRDERKYNSRLPRPFRIPEDVLAEAIETRARMKVGIYIGWYSHDSLYENQGVLP